jgi:hypothetical protein
MTRAKKDPDTGYRLPDNLEPDDSVCIRVYVPNADEYIAAFWQSYEFLSKWVAWERNTACDAKTAADIFRISFERARLEWLCSDGDCGIMDVRTKPDEPCTLQKQVSCDEWEDWAIITDCTQIVPPPYNDDGVVEIDDVIWAIKETIVQVHDWLIAGKSAAEIKYLLTGLGIPGTNAMVDDMAATSEEDRQDAIDDQDWQDMRDVNYCRRDECHLENYTLPDDIAPWLVCLLRNLENWSSAGANKIQDWCAELINAVVPAQFLALVNMFPGLGAGFGFGDPDCWLTDFFDFSGGSTHGFTVQSENATIWTGTGWADDYPQKEWDSIAIHSPILSARTVRRVVLLLTEAVVGSNPGAKVYLEPGTLLQGERFGSLATYTIDTNFEMDGINDFLYLNVDAYYGAQQHFDAVLYKVIIWYDE